MRHVLVVILMLFAFTGTTFATEPSAEPSAEPTPEPTASIGVPIETTQPTAPPTDISTDAEEYIGSTVKALIIFGLFFCAVFLGIAAYISSSRKP